MGQGLTMGLLPNAKYRTARTVGQVSILCYVRTAIVGHLSECLLCYLGIRTGGRLSDCLQIFLPLSFSCFVPSSKPSPLSKSKPSLRSVVVRESHNITQQSSSLASLAALAALAALASYKAR